MRHFQTFTRSQDPQWLSSADVKEFLTLLAVTKKVSASTQNQAFHALLFFYRHVLNQEVGPVEGVVRAKRKPYVPVVLSRAAIAAILPHLSPPSDLVVHLLYGCGQQLSECLNLRVQCLNCDAGVLTIYDGKGVYLVMVFPGKTAHLYAEDRGIPAVSSACNTYAKGD